ncbi:DUF418 domain-containing protein [Flavihumibacter petaseus]|uniref:DUF418 domain-containing protein n=1 Tax=Flavihumibacter petaseus NBRC 106054 TaxID=1220578 RepID=A0A0E9N0K6_9BACT|nr:DUF418 domain-containing protein [Flavihumibacter petaseus]GAO43537.1 hypothetical protein FPE01S_02_06420 [Flavihumibacter petaseus NBRC 106054]
MIFPLSEGPETRLSPGPQRTPFPFIIGVSLLFLWFTAAWETGGFTSNLQKWLLQSSKGWGYRAYGAAEILLRYKMEGLLFLVAGAGLYVFLHDARKKDGKLNIDLLIRRQIWLILLGVINAFVFLFSGDILFLLGVAGILFFSFAALQPKHLLLLSIFCCVAWMGKNYWDYADHKDAHNKYLAAIAVEKKWPKDSTARAKSDTLTADQKSEKEAWEGIAKGVKYNKDADKERTKGVQKVSYAENSKTLMPANQQRQSSFIYSKGIWGAGMFLLLGMALYGGGFFHWQRSRSTLLLIAVGTLTAGVLLAWWRLHQQQVAMKDYGNYIGKHALPFHFFQPLEQLLMVTGYACKLMWVFTGTWWRKLVALLALPGQMPLTVYLLQCGATAFFFNGSGMGYYGRLSQPQLYFFAAEMGILVLGACILWSKVFRRGPAEWLLDYAITGERPPAIRETQSFQTQTDLV